MVETKLSNMEDIVMIDSETNRNIQIRTVVAPWIFTLKLQQQSVLLLATRGADGLPKHHVSKNIQRAYRGTVLLAAKQRRLLRIGEHGDNFISLGRFNPVQWNSDINDYLNVVDEIPHHFHLHLMHGAQIIGYKHPASFYRNMWNTFYIRCVEDAHLNVETEEQMDKRLNDFADEPDEDSQ